MDRAGKEKKQVQGDTMAFPDYFSLPIRTVRDAGTRGLKQRDFYQCPKAPRAKRPVGTDGSCGWHKRDLGNRCSNTAYRDFGNEPDRTKAATPFSTRSSTRPTEYKSTPP